MQVFQSLDDPKLTASVRGGGVGVIPTDTVYGLVCSAANKEAVRRVFIVKNRANQPGTILAASIEQLAELGIKQRYLKAVEQYWPNPLSIIIPCGPELGYLHMGKDSLAVRIPANDELIAMLSKTGPLVTTSANTPGATVASSVAEAEAYFGEKVDFYVDGGELGQQPPSTIIRIVDDAVEVLRQGAVQIDENGRITGIL
jgi:L-threonylcarbamoyladenylate synthase